MKILIYGHDKEKNEDMARKAGFEVVKNNPEIVASCGGDGTLMKAEKDFPGIPKFILHKSKTTKKGHDISAEKILEKISQGEYRVENEMKIEASFKGKTITGLNEVIVHNSDPEEGYSL